MHKNDQLGLYVSYYLSRFDKRAYDRLGYGNRNITHDRLGKILNVKPNTIKNWRDEFDPIHGHRAGWYQRPMRVLISNIAKSLEGLNEDQVYNLVNSIIIETNNEIVKILNDQIIKAENDSTVYILRGPTGKKAESFFILNYKNYKLFEKGTLKDTRDYGCGYDFEVRTNDDIYFVEVKGLSSNDGGILFTDKEWRIANEKKEKYFVYIVRDIDETPDIKIINNPSIVLTPKKSVYTSIQTQWNVKESDII